MDDTSTAERSVDAEVEINFDRTDLLMLSAGRQYEKQMAVEADDGTTVHLSIMLIGESADGK